MTLALVVGSVAGGLIAPHLAYRWQIGAGLAIGAGGLLLATRFTAAATLWDARAAAAILGLGLGLAQPVLIVAVQEAFGPGLRGTVTAANALCRSIGSILGVSVFGAAFNGQMGAQAGRLAPGILEALAGVAERPSDWVQVLLEPGLQGQIPAEVRTAAVEAVREMMVGATRAVFWIAAGLMLAGVLVSQFVRGIVGSEGEVSERGTENAKRRDDACCRQTSGR